ncbi:MAG: 30S ribosome-binding factor RbfA [Alphaproteobacteria bacterium]|jgi:ribosome-binding factor A|nr:30S ribosome-binding factor RbfA [Alphaproteobacteria bacterium]
MKPQTDRQVRVNELMKAEIATALTRNDSGNQIVTKAMVSVTGIDVAPNLRNATVYVSTLNSSVDHADVIKALNSDAYLYQKALGRLRIKYIPKLKFVFDESYITAQSANERIRNLSGLDKEETSEVS